MKELHEAFSKNQLEFLQGLYIYDEADQSITPVLGMNAIPTKANFRIIKGNTVLSMADLRWASYDPQKGFQYGPDQYQRFERSEMTSELAEFLDKAIPIYCAENSLQEAVRTLKALGYTAAQEAIKKDIAEFQKEKDIGIKLDVAMYALKEARESLVNSDPKEAEDMRRNILLLEEMLQVIFDEV